MKRKILVCLLLCLCVFGAVFGISACQKSNETDKPPQDSEQDPPNNDKEPSEIKLEKVAGATVNEEEKTVFMLVANDVEAVPLRDKVECSPNCRWGLYYNDNGMNAIDTKIATQPIEGGLFLGDNTFYILVFSSDDSQFESYKLTVHRTYDVTISFYDNKENLLKTDEVVSGRNYKINYVPEIAGYTFNNWNDGDGNAVKNAFTPYKPIQLYADCTANEYTANLDLNGGVGVESLRVKVNYDSNFTFSVPTREGYAFGGWFSGTKQVTDERGESLNVWNFIKDTDFTAEWIKNEYSVTLNKIAVLSGGKTSGEGNYEHGSSVTVTAETYGGNVFVGWFDGDNKLTDELSYTFTMPMKNVVYTAKWTAVRTVAEPYNYGDVSPLSDKYRVGDLVTIKANTREGYTFVGWFDGDTLFTYSSETTIEITAEDKIYKAKWIKVTIDVSSPEMGETTGLTGKYNVGEGVAVTAKSNIGYDFVGWFKGETLLTDDLTYIITMPSEDTTYTAKWLPKPEMSMFEFNSTATNCTVTGIKDSSLTQITVADYVTEISEGAFNGATLLESITIPFIGKNASGEEASKTTLFGYIFGRKDNGGVATEQFFGTGIDAGSKVKYYLPSTLRQVTVTGGNLLTGAFSFCNLLTRITLPDGISSIAYGAFSNCTNLAVVNIPDSVLTIEDYAFFKCGFTEIGIPEKVSSIGENAFAQCVELTEIIIPASVVKIGWEVFDKCTSLTSVTFENPQGWWVTESRYATSGTAIDGEILANPETAATYFKTDYKDYYWKK